MYPESEIIDNKEWLKDLFDNIETVRENEQVVPFKIVDIRRNSFLVKTKGLYAYVPFNCMPWKYHHTNYWKSVLLSLKEMVFFGKVTQIERISDDSNNIRILVDATATLLKEAKLRPNTDYKGIVILKKSYGVFVDIGCHFNWKCGSLTGLLHHSKFSDNESFMVCEEGQSVIVSYVGKDEHGLLFEKEGYIDLNAEYTGKLVRVRVYRSENGGLDFLVQGKYNADMPVKNFIYGEKINMVKNMMNNWQGGELIDCQVLYVSSNSRFVLKYLFPEYQHLAKFIGQQIQVKVFRNGDGSLNFMAGKYKAIMPPSRTIYGEKKKLVKSAMSCWPDGEILDCKVINVDIYTGLFIVKWIHQP